MPALWGVQGGTGLQRPYSTGLDAGTEMLKVVFLQAALIGLAGVLCGVLVGVPGAVSALIGGLAYLLPNLFFVLRLKRADAAGQTSVTLFFVGELLKVVCTIVILFAAVRYYPVHWLCLMGGVLAAVKANLFAFLLKI